MKKKIFAMFILFILILIGGAYIFIQTKSEFIRDKISTLVEDVSGAPLTIESLPSVGFFPSPNISIGKATWGTEDFSITVDSADVGFSLFALLGGKVSLSALQLDKLKLIYNDNAIVKIVEVVDETKANAGQETVKVGVPLSNKLTRLVAAIPNDIRIKNGYIEYKDEKQHLIMQNIQTRIDNFEINQNAKASLSSDITYTMTSEKPAKTYDLKFDTDFSFLFMGENLNLELKKLIISPKNGFTFSKEIAFSGSTDVFIRPFYLRSFSAQISSPFMSAKLDQKGDINSNEGMFSIDAKVFPLAIAEAFAPHKKFKNTKELQEAQLNATVSFNKRAINLQNLEAKLGNASVKSMLTYDIKKDELFGGIDFANIQLSHFIADGALNDVANGAEGKSANANTEKISATSNSSSNTSALANSEKKSPGLQLPASLQKTSFDVGLKASNIKYDKFLVDTVTAKLQGKNSLLTIKPIQIQSMDSSISAKIDMDLTKKQTIAVDINIPSIDMSVWSKTLLNNEALAGYGSIQSTLNFPISNPISNLSGKGNIKLSSLHVQVKRVPFLEKIVQKSRIKPKTYQFTRGHIPFKIKGSVVQLNDAFVSSLALLIEANGDVNLKKQTMDLSAQVALAQKLSIPVSITGHVNDPIVKIGIPNPVNTVDNLLQFNITKKTGKEIINALDKIFGK